MRYYCRVFTLRQASDSITSPQSAIQFLFSAPIISLSTTMGNLSSWCNFSSDTSHRWPTSAVHGLKFISPYLFQIKAKLISITQRFLMHWLLSFSCPQDRATELSAQANSFLHASNQVNMFHHIIISSRRQVSEKQNYNGTVCARAVGKKHKANEVNQN